MASEQRCRPSAGSLEEPYRLLPGSAPGKGVGEMSNRLGREDASLPLSVAGRVDERCDRFEEAWIAGRTPRIEDFLESAAEADRPALLGELVRLELEYRRQRGESPALEDYRQRFPEHADRIE